MGEPESVGRTKAKLPGRQDFLRWAGTGFLSLWGLGFLWVFSSFIKRPTSHSSLTETMLKIGAVDSLSPGEAKLVRRGNKPIFVIRTEDDSLVGLSAVCTHVNCVLNYDSGDGMLHCPCHDGLFDINGNVVSGPPPRPLKRFKVEERLGEIFLHL
jgi:cytochrome b6-f complex iron-sulfur subunit